MVFGYPGEKCSPEEICLFHCERQSVISIEPFRILGCHEVFTGSVVVEPMFPGAVVQFPALDSSPMFVCQLTGFIGLMDDSGDLVEVAPGFCRYTLCERRFGRPYISCRPSSNAVVMSVAFGDCICRLVASMS